MKKEYKAPQAEVLSFAQKDVVTSSGFLFDWDLPSIDLGNGDWEWSENGDILKL